VLRPADATETAEAWKAAVAHTGGPTILVFSRQKLPILDRAAVAAAAGVRRGGYVLLDAAGGRPEAIVLATGAEVHVAMVAVKALQAEGVAARLVSLPSWELFAAQPTDYRESVLPAAVTARVSIEAATTFGWHRWVGDRGVAIGIDHFGASAPAERLFQEFGLTADAVRAAVLRILGRPGK
jgi:transketolase